MSALTSSHMKVALPCASIPPAGSLQYEDDPLRIAKLWPASMDLKAVNVPLIKSEFAREE